MNYQLVAPCLFGLEGLAGDELKRMGMENVRVEDRRVLFSGDASAIVKANICRRAVHIDGFSNAFHRPVIGALCNGCIASANDISDWGFLLKMRK